MPFKEWFQGRGGEGREPLEIDDLIVLGRFDEAEQRLMANLRSSPDDQRSRLRLGDVYLAAGRLPQAADAYLNVAEALARQGFYDRSIALLAKVRRLTPHDPKVEMRLGRVQRSKELERLREELMQGLEPAPGAGAGRRLSPLEAQQIWENLAPTPLLERLAGPQLQRLLRALEIERRGAGHLLMTRGRQDEVLFVVASGSVDVEVELANGSVPKLRSLRPGDILGDRALFHHEPWPANYRTGGETILLALRRVGLQGILTGNPDPRVLIDALRSQQNDWSIRCAVEQLLEGG